VLVIAFDPAWLKARPFPVEAQSRMIAAVAIWGSRRVKIARMAALAAVLVLAGAGCAEHAPPAAQVSSADLARQATAPIDVGPFVAALYRDKYLAGLDGATSGVAVISPTGNRIELRFCKHPDCQMSDDEIATRALDRCNLGFARRDPSLRCLVFDRNGMIRQPYRFWTDADFEMPNPEPSPLSIGDPAQLADPKVFADQYLVMTPAGQLRISLYADGRANFWDTGDFFHQGTWSLKDGGVCVNSVDQRSIVTCGKLFGTQPSKIVGIVLDLFPGKLLPVRRFQTIVKVRPAPQGPVTQE
jgi:hypothetical protein